MIANPILKRFWTAMTLFIASMVAAALWLRWEGHGRTSSIAALIGVAGGVVQSVALLWEHLRGGQ